MDFKVKKLNFFKEVTSSVTSLIKFCDSILLNNLLNNLSPLDASTHFPGASRVLPKGFKCRLA